MKNKNDINKTLESLYRQIEVLTNEVNDLKTQAEKENALFKNHLLRIASNESVDFNSVYFNMPYLDLNPDEAFKIYNKQSYNFVLLDVSMSNFSYSEGIEESIKIQLEFLEMKIDELPSKSTPIYVISEKGIRSILACELLYKLGFININHISGGHKFWPGHKNLSLAA